MFSTISQNNALPCSSSVDLTSTSTRAYLSTAQTSAVPTAPSTVGRTLNLGTRSQPTANIPFEKSPSSTVGTTQDEHRRIVTQPTFTETTQSSPLVTHIEQILHNDTTKLPEHLNYTVGMEAESDVPTALAGKAITFSQL